MHPARRPIRFPWQQFWIVFGLALAVNYLAAALARVTYPYDLEFIEDGTLIQALRHAQGLPVYLPPNAEFVPHAYPPLYPWLGGQLIRLCGPGYLPLRLLSLLATLLTAVLLYRIGRREGASAGWALTGPALFLAANRAAGGWYELARADALFLALLLAGIALAVYRGGTLWGQVLAAVLLALAFLTKQPGLYFALWAGLYLVLKHRGAAWRYWGTAALLFGLAVFLLQRETGGWFGRYVFEIQAGSSQLEARRFVRSALFDFGGVVLPLGTLWAIQAARALRREGWRGWIARPWLLMIFAALAASLAGRTSVGGNLNHWMPGYAFLCLAPALWSRQVGSWQSAGRRTAPAVLGAAVLLQALLFLFDPVRTGSGFVEPVLLRPTPAMRRSGDRLVQRLRETPGEVLVLMHPYYAVLAGKAPSVQIPALWHARRRGADPLPRDLAARIASRSYALIVSDESPYFETDPALVQLIERYYAPAEALLPSESPPTLSGMRVRPQQLYRPRP